ncbi:Hypothetical predicted protein [Olea europaea subsp. europaea]|uniref:Retrotransposon gag domain-containing protein n=1 Tax=Olea europaea subsp. europaea TaxID=158383 RepID=A0A8S0RC87_OLEEU|nr:Hypothetical predicted protein [Olea europaea subsp. europaea]
MESFEELSKSVDQLCLTLSMSNLTVPRIDKFDNVFTFINEFELATATLPEDCRIKLLVKAFPPGRYSSWYDRNIKPIAGVAGAWKAIKKNIIKRYSDTEDRDRQFLRLQSMKFVENGSEKLFDYVEDLVFTLSLAFPDQKDDDTKIRYVKAHLPPSVQVSLRQISEYNNASYMDDFMKGIRQYDKLKLGGQKTDEQGAKVSTAELVTLLKELSKGIKQEQEATRNVVAALRPSRNSSPGRSNSSTSNQSRSDHVNRPRSISPFASSSHQRGPSPKRSPVEGNSCQNPECQARANKSNHLANQGYRESKTPPPNQPRSSSPKRKQGCSNCCPQPSSSGSCQHQQLPAQDRPVFDEKVYFDKFGVPLRPCKHCGCNHWDKHCPQHLN